VQDLGEVARRGSARGPVNDGMKGLLPHEMLEAQLSVDLGAFQHTACLGDVDYVLWRALGRRCRRARGGAAVWRAHGMCGARSGMLGPTVVRVKAE
jgi:hypothetical protein